MFGCIAAGRLVQTNLQQVDVNKYVFELSDAHTINHIVVFLLGSIPFEAGYAATVHLQWPNTDWQLLGMLSNDKPSAIFRIRKNDLSLNQPPSSATLGISIEPIEVVQQQVANLTLQPRQQQLVRPGANLTQAGTLSQRILENLYNYVTSFAVQEVPFQPGGMVVGQVVEQGFIPLKVFQTWFENLGRKLTNNPDYLSDKNV
ncbi:hypothetical protein J3Q64DRAFT_1675495 [Phycomyces blakesleeanus]|uniref:Uncharacterized protein n=2 Tax=Phycomyces blakesleeanus TaxID=4837 RepID=A0A162PUC5_PHYB8|nr:hypothetical protein PHYBLDRAFT_123367 [Phycomyces blakesleeanus NRRL 1555(-)]OAD76057.1 hypothetical protein PHYBLDRAFT_123367 [Phycomyces blakesleeanus NRRL 1555(-)]|eukprot:XP_018294097.1 hypothetical protein PHYBLDRAFT_123367 [Phycomyces blakesleeanus NRRL 1555(-)]